MDRDTTVYQCHFQLYVDKATVSIKFPCIFFIEWKTANGKKTAEGKNRPTSVNTQVAFQQTLELATELVFDNTLKQFAKKQTMINLNLISKARQDQSKLVGRVAVDLSTIANSGQYNEAKSYKLAYCSVDGEIMFSAVMRSKRKTNMNPQDLDKSSFNQYLSFYSGQKKDQIKKGEREICDEETSIGYGRRVNQNVIDFHQNAEFKPNQRQHQTFYILQSPRQNSAFNLTNQLPRASKQKSMGTQTGLTALQTEQMIRSPSLSKQFGRLSLASKNGEGSWERDKVQFRDEIDTNRHKIDQMQKKIMELYTNLEDSKRHIEFAERQNRQKEELIKKLKGSMKGEENRQDLVNDWKEKYSTLQKESSQQSKKYKFLQESLRKQIQQNQFNFQNLRRQTEQLRKIWSQKKQHFEQKLRKSDQLIREKQNKINELCLKNQEFTKFKYQNDLLKVLSDQKQSKIKLMQRDFLKLSEQLNEIKRNNWAEDNYKLKLQNAQSLKSIQDLTKQYEKCQIQIEKYRENYIKIQTAYQIQNKTYESSKEKYSHLENSVFNFQKENIQLKNSMENAKKTNQEIQKKYLQTYSLLNKVQGDLQLAKNQLQKLSTWNENLKREKDQLTSLVEKHKIEDEVRKEDFEKQLKRMQNSFMNRLQTKETAHNSSKRQFQATIAELKELINAKQQQQLHKKEQYQAQLSKLMQQIELGRQQVQTNLHRIKNLQQTILDKQQIIKLSKQEIDSLKIANNELYQSISKMKQTENQLQENIAILEEQSQKIIYILEQKQETDRQIEMIRQKIKEAIDQQAIASLKVKELEQLNQHLSARNDEILRKYEQIENEKHFKDQEIKLLNNKIEQINIENASMRQQWLESKGQIDKLREIIKEINERYEQHIKNEEKYVQEINSIRQQKDQIEIMMNRNSNQLALHNQQLQSKIIELQQQVQKYESCIEIHEQERRGLQSTILDHDQLQIEQKSKQEQFQMKIEYLEGQVTKYQNVKLEYQNQIQRLEKQIKQSAEQLINQQSKSQKMSRMIEQKNAQITQLLRNCRANQTIIQEKASSIAQLQIKISELENQIAHLVEIKNSQLFTLQQAKEPQLKSLFQGEQQFSQRQQELQQLLFESDRKNEALQSKLMALTAELEQISKKQSMQDIQQIYSSFNQFQRQQMAKIIEQQRIEIDRIETQLKNKSTADSQGLQRKIVELQNHIVQLSSSFKLEIDRILTEQQQRESIINGGLTVITQENSQDEMYKSERSLLNSPSRAKSSIQVIQLLQMRQKCQLLQQQKLQLQQQFSIVEEEKFNFLSTINQKDIEIEQINHIRSMLKAENNELRAQLQKNIEKCKYLQCETQSLKNQLTFGSTINFNMNENSVTRSQPILTLQSHSYENKNVQIESLKAQIERYKNREEELLWNMKDLEMQLQTVTQNLNMLNGSSMNSVLNTDSNKNIEIDEQKQEQKRIRAEQGYSKEKLLLQLKKNEELKDISHNLIKVLKQRQSKFRDQQKLMIEKPPVHLQNDELDAINRKISRLLTQFQTIKVYVMKSQSGKLKEEATRILGQMKNVEIMKNILVFEQQLKSMRCLSEKTIKIDR